jgi:tRNA(Ile)-lysidine synthase TilS/MesJ
MMAHSNGVDEMNKARRTAIRNILNDLEKLEGLMADIRDAIEIVKDEEREAFDNMPESLQNSERGEACSNAADALDEAFSALEEMENQRAEAVTQLETAGE